MGIPPTERSAGEAQAADAGAHAALGPRPAWGEFERRLDYKSRLIVPQALRTALGERYVITRGPEGAILLVPSDRWAQVEPLLQESVRKSGLRSAYRVMNSRADVVLDPQGRLTIPRYLREWAGLQAGDSVVVMGVGATAEIWNKCRWEEFLQTFTLENVKEAARTIGLEGLLF